ncbi:MAG: BatA domain-containing protein [Bacteroidota bacterium]
MQFLYPNILYGLFAVSIPLIIHLLNFQKYKKIYFTQTDLIADLKQQTRKQSTLRHWLILLLRMLVIAMLVMAFANPYIAREEKSSSSGDHVTVYLDNSFSMQAQTSEGTLLDEAKSKARALAGAYESSTRFQLITNELLGKQQRWLTREQFETEIDEVEFAPQFRQLSEIVNRQHQLIKEDESRNATIYFLSDFQKVSYDLEQEDLDSNFAYNYIPVQSFDTPNAYFDSVWFSSPALFLDQNAELNIRLRQQGDLSTVPLKLFVDGKQRVAATAEFNGQNMKTIKLNVNIRKTGIHNGRLEISDNSIDFDNTFYFSYNVPENVNVLVLGEDEKPNKYFSALFKNDSLVQPEFRSYRNIDYQNLSSYSAVILDQLKSIPSGLRLALNDFVEKGKSLVVFPDMEAEKESYNEMLANYQGVNIGKTQNDKENRVRSIEWDSDFFKGIFDNRPDNPDYPSVFQDVKLSYNVNSLAEPLIMQSDGNPFLLRSKEGKGFVYIFAVGSTEKSSNFVTHPLFAVLYKMIFDGVHTGNLYYVPGDNDIYSNPRLEINNKEVPVLVNRNTQKEVIPQVIQRKDGLKLLFSSVTTSGLWNLQWKEDENIQDIVAFNYDNRESDVRLVDIKNDRPQDIAVLEHTAEKFTTDIKRQQEGRKLWLWFIIAALFFLLMEVILLRIWKL